MTNTGKKQYQALVLLSGGLDSQLAVCVLRDQGIHVEAITFVSPFFSAEKGERAAAALGVPHHIVDFTEDILDLLRAPPHGFGKAMNPCIDCHARMIMRTGERLRQRGLDFIATGEVLGQRPMSQNKQSLGVVAKDSDCADLLVRPLSAALLPPTKPIREGWVDVARLPAFSGRNRTPQIEWARKIGLVDYPAPAGGCLLTDKPFCRKLRDLFDHEGPDADRTNVWLLKIGRHLRLSDRVKIIVGADERENALLEQRAGGDDLRIMCAHRSGPTVIAPAHMDEALLRTAAAVCAGYAKAPAGRPVEVLVIRNGEARTVNVVPMPFDQADALRVAR